ncbi:MAG: hypothetical protein ABIV43_02215 [Candidatus Saccharimonadales bacterium]
MEPTTELRFEAIGTNWYIGIGTVVTDDEYDNIIKNIRLRIAAYDQAFSRFKSDSIVSKLALRPGSVKLPP